MASHNSPPAALEAKLVVLGSQGVGKTSLVYRYVQHDFIPSNKVQSTVGASFLSARLLDPESGTTIRLQLWDTAGQERFRSISRLYYRGANAAILCYDVTSQKSFEEMGVWLKELRENCGRQNEDDMILHIVGTKSDVVAAEPKKREVPFERCIGYVAEQLYPEMANAASSQASSPPKGLGVLAGKLNSSSNRSSGFWGQEAIWDCCHEVSAKDGEGIDEVFRVITRKLIEQQARRMERQKRIDESRGRTPGVDGAGAGVAGYFDHLPNGGSFRVGHGNGDKRKSWLSSLATPGGLTSVGDDEGVQDEVTKGLGRKRCC